MSEQDYEQLTLFPEGSHASLSASPGGDEAKRMTVISGQRCAELYRKSGPLGSLVRMLLESSQWRSTRCFLTWKISATPAKRLLFRLVPSMPPTDGTDAPLFVGTPTAISHARSKRFREGRIPNPEEAAKMWPTPTAQDFKCRGPNSRQQGLSDVIKLFPTPTTGAGMCGGTGNFNQLKALEAAGQITEEERRSMAAGNGGRLNPTWVEWLMGFPIGWTDLNASETP